MSDPEAVRVEVARVRDHWARDVLFEAWCAGDDRARVTGLIGSIREPTISGSLCVVRSRGADLVERKVVEVELPNGVVALVRAADLESGRGASKAGPLGKFDLQAVTGTLEGLSTAIKAALTKAAPDKVTVEFGLELAVTSGVLTGLLVDGDGSGSLTVTLEWGSGSES